MMQKNNFISLSLVLALCIGTALSCQMIQSGVSAQERAQILEVHNRLRASVAMGRVSGQPGAQNMKEIVWDDELAGRAQGWANQCTFKHDPQRTSNRYTMGQNMAIIWSTAEISDGDFPSRIQNWFREVNQYAFGSSWSPKTGHYSQLVWAETSMVGCGFTYYKDSSKYNKLFVCNYGPGGNVVGSMPYSVGNPDCSRHNLGPSNRYAGLCSGGGYQNFGGDSFQSFGHQQPQPKYFGSSTFAPSTFAPQTFRSTTFAPHTFRSSSFAPQSFHSSTFATPGYQSYHPKGSFSTPFQQPQQSYNTDYTFKNFFNKPHSAFAPKSSFGSNWNALSFGGLFKRK